MEIRPYSDNDRQACLDILGENTPEVFIPGDRDSLCEFLANLPGPYFVGEAQGTVVACGGWAMESVDVVALTWGMVRRALHRHGIGRALLRFRLASIRMNTQANLVRLHTVQLVQGFFAREGWTGPRWKSLSTSGGRPRGSSRLPGGWSGRESKDAPAPKTTISIALAFLKKGGRPKSAEPRLTPAVRGWRSQATGVTR